MSALSSPAFLPLITCDTEQHLTEVHMHVVIHRKKKSYLFVGETLLCKIIVSV